MTHRIEQLAEGVTLHMGDALEVMEGLDSVDAIITDPPYCSGSVSEASRTASKGQGLRSENIAKLGWFVGDNMGTAGLAMLLRSMAFRGVDILSPHGSVLIFCDWRMVPNLAPSVESAGLRFQNLVVWDKGMMGLGLGFRAQHEIILHYTVGAPKYHDLGTSNVIKTSRVSASDREHQTQKPVELMSTLVKVVCPPGGVVLDPFMGSASTGVAAISSGRSFVGIERDTVNFDIACRRIQAALDAPDMFVDRPAAAKQEAMF